MNGLDDLLDHAERVHDEAIALRDGAEDPRGGPHLRHQAREALRVARLLRARAAELWNEAREATP